MKTSTCKPRPRSQRDSAVSPAPASRRLSAEVDSLVEFVQCQDGRLSCCRGVQTSTLHSDQIIFQTTKFATSDQRQQQISCGRRNTKILFENKMKLPKRAESLDGFERPVPCVFFSYVGGIGPNHRPTQWARGSSSRASDLVGGGCKHRAKWLNVRCFP